MTAEACREWRERLGAYALGGLAADEQAAVRAHLDGCPDCRAEAASLGSVAGLLAQTDPAHVASPPSPPAELGDRVAGRIAAERGRRRRRTRIRIGLAGAAATLAVTALAQLALSPDDGGEGSRRVVFRSLPTGVRIGATLQPRDFGTEIRMRVSGVHSGTLCRVFLLRSGGSPIPAGSFRYREGDRGAQDAVLTSGLDLSEARAIGLRAYGHTLVEPLNRAAAIEASSDRQTTEEANT